jgi:hypothetical protein
VQILRIFLATLHQNAFENRKEFLKVYITQFYPKLAASWLSRRIEKDIDYSDSRHRGRTPRFEKGLYSTYQLG